MVWQDPYLALSPDKCHCAVKMMDINDLKTLIKKNAILFPAVTFFNQQGNRWSESQQVFIENTLTIHHNVRNEPALKLLYFPDYCAVILDYQCFLGHLFSKGLRQTA